MVLLYGSRERGHRSSMPPWLAPVLGLYCPWLFWAVLKPFGPDALHPLCNLASPTMWGSHTNVYLSVYLLGGT